METTLAGKLPVSGVCVSERVSLKPDLIVFVGHFIIALECGRFWLPISIDNEV